MADRNGHFFERLVKKHVSGQLKVAPEHVSEEVLRLMNKPPYAVYERFARRFSAATQRANKPQYLLPYYISSHPGSTLSDAIELALTLKKQKFAPDQVQDFYPTPGTISTCMFYTERDPMTGKPVYVAKTPKEKAMQRALLQFNQRRNWPLIREALKMADREDLIGPGKECLVPEDTHQGKSTRSSHNKRPHKQAAESATDRPDKPTGKAGTSADGKAGKPSVTKRGYKKPGGKTSGKATTKGPAGGRKGTGR
jgi:hypothetical protein